MTRSPRVSCLVPLLVVIALAATASAAQGIEPHWYKCEPMAHGAWEAGCTASGSGYEKTRLSSSPIAVKLNGGFSFKVEKKVAIECDATGSGEIWNPAGGTAGEGLITSPLTLKCGGGGCTSTPTLVPLSLPWKTLLEVVGTQITDRIKPFEIEVKCPGMPNDEFEGHLNPELVNGLPSFLKFTTGTGTLLDLSHLNVQVTGSVRVEGPTGDTVLATNP